MIPAAENRAEVSSALLLEESITHPDQSFISVSVLFSSASHYYFHFCFQNTGLIFRQLTIVCCFTIGVGGFTLLFCYYLFSSLRLALGLFLRVEPNSANVSAT